MKTTIYIHFIFLVFIFFACKSNNKSNQKTENQFINLERTEINHDTDTLNLTAKVSCDSIDLTKYPSKKIYQRFQNETVKSVDGYGVYYINATVELSRSINSENEDVLKLHYELPSHFSFGNWLSIRREFENVVDLSNCKGFQLEINVETPSDAKLRLTLCDAKNNDDVNKHRADEMWWFDFEDGVLNGSGEWNNQFAPFIEFYKSSGEGTRYNDFKMDVSKVIAYEINIISKAGQYSRGDVLFKSILSY